MDHLRAPGFDPTHSTSILNSLQSAQDPDGPGLLGHERTKPWEPRGSCRQTVGLARGTGLAWEPCHQGTQPVGWPCS